MFRKSRIYDDICADVDTSYRNGSMDQVWEPQIYELHKYRRAVLACKAIPHKQRNSILDFYDHRLKFDLSWNATWIKIKEDSNIVMLFLGAVVGASVAFIQGHNTTGWMVILLASIILVLLIINKKISG